MRGGRGRHLLMNPGVVDRGDHTSGYGTKGNRKDGTTGGLHSEQARNRNRNVNNVPGLNKHGNHVNGGWVDAPPADDGT